MEHLEDCLEKPKVLDDDKNKKLDCILGTVYTMSALPLMSAGVYAGVKYYPVGLIATVGTCIASMLLYSISCWYFTPPSQRGDWKEQHPQVPEEITNYLGK
jgi:hypothetical protein